MNILMSIKINYLKIKDELRRIRERGVRVRDIINQGKGKALKWWFF